MQISPKIEKKVIDELTEIYTVINGGSPLFLKKESDEEPKNEISKSTNKLNSQMD